MALLAPEGHSPSRHQPTHRTSARLARCGRLAPTPTRVCPCPTPCRRQSITTLLDGNWQENQKDREHRKKTTEREDYGTEEIYFGPTQNKTTLCMMEFVYEVLAYIYEGSIWLVVVCTEVRHVWLVLMYHSNRIKLFLFFS